MKQQLLEANINPELALEKLWLAAKIIENTMEAIFVTNEKGVIFVVNPAFSELTGYPANKAVGQTPYFLKTAEGDTLNQRFWRKSIKEGSWEGELNLRRQNGSSFPARFSITTIAANQTNTPHYLAMFHDITSYRNARQEASRMAFFDPLTHLLNRNSFLQHLDQAIAQNHHRRSKVALLYLDLDRFKTINDALGHSVGDYLLQEVSNRLLNQRTPRQTVARLGGDEFGIILHNVRNQEEVVRIAESILDTLRKPYLWADQELHLTASLGICMYPDDGQDAASLLQFAEIALYRSKHSERSNFRFYSSSFNTQTLERLVMENSLRHAIERDEFLIYYQPHVDLTTGRITGAEALIRWQHPDLGLIPPAEFLPIAEESGILAAIDNWVLESVCAQLAHWRTEGVTDLYIAVNLSGQQLRQPNFVELVQQCLRTYQIKPGQLELEVTEGIIMDNLEQTAQILGQIKSLGVTIAIDDFGTGHSSLSNLRNLPVQHVKIDRSFVKDSPQNIDDAAIITAIIAMSHSLDLQVIAEGVETDDQLNFLKKLHCDCVQGFVYDAPLPVEELERLMQQQPFLNQETVTEGANLA